MIGEKTEMIWNPSIGHDRFSFFLGFFFALRSDVVKSVGQIFDTLMKLLFEFIVITRVIGQSIELLRTDPFDDKRERERRGELL